MAFPTPPPSTRRLTYYEDLYGRRNEDEEFDRHPDHCEEETDSEADSSKVEKDHTGFFAKFAAPATPKRYDHIGRSKPREGPRQEACNDLANHTSNPNNNGDARYNIAPSLNKKPSVSTNEHKKLTPKKFGMFSAPTAKMEVSNTAGEAMDEMFNSGDLGNLDDGFPTLDQNKSETDMASPEPNTVRDTASKNMRKFDISELNRTGDPELDALKRQQLESELARISRNQERRMEREKLKGNNHAGPADESLFVSPAPDSIFNLTKTGDPEADALKRQKLESELARISRNQERRMEREKLKDNDRAGAAEDSLFLSPAPDAVDGDVEDNTFITAGDHVQEGKGKRALRPRGRKTGADIIELRPTSTPTLGVGRKKARYPTGRYTTRHQEKMDRISKRRVTRAFGKKDKVFDLKAGNRGKMAQRATALRTKAKNTGGGTKSRPKARNGKSMKGGQGFVLITTDVEDIEEYVRY